MGSGHRTARAAVLVGSLLGGSGAAAQGLDAERFVPAVGSEPGFVFEHPAVSRHLGWGLGLFVDLADDPVVARNGAGDVVARPLDTAATVDLVGAIGLFGWSEVGVHLPLQLVYDGDGDAASAGLGDLRLVPKVALLRSGGADRHVLLGLALPLSLPTGDDEALRGAGGVTFGARLLAAFHTGRVGLGANVGFQYRAERPAGLPWGHELAFAAMASYEVVPERLRVHAELFGGQQLDVDVDDDTLPLEVLGGATYAIAPTVDLHGGVGLGVGDAPGAPDVRAVLGLRFTPGAPERRGFLDGDGDGVLDMHDRCPGELEDHDGFRDDDGCVEFDNDQDGIVDDLDECPEQPEEPGGDLDGCPSRTFVTIVDGEIQIFGKVQFKTGSAEIDQKSDPLLDQIAAAMTSNPGAARIRIEGHTDGSGDAAINQRLSEDRARSVERALIQRGVADDRLETRGYGESRPAAPNRTAAGRAKNRRVEFIIVEGG